MRFWMGLAFRLLRGTQPWKFEFTTLLSILGLILGVASLTVSMGVMSGFEETLQKSISDISGHIQVFKLKISDESAAELKVKLQKSVTDLDSMMSFLSVEGIAAQMGRAQGVLLQGLDPQGIDKVVKLSDRLVAGTVSFKADDGSIPVLIGQVLSQNLKLKIGDSFKVVVPIANEVTPQEFRRKLSTLKVVGIIDMGKYEYDERNILLALDRLQEWAEVGDRISGYLLRIKDFKMARTQATALAKELGLGFRVRDWREINENIFEAVKLERTVIFCVILLIVIASAANVAISLYVSVVKKFSDFSILKTMGVSPRKIILILAYKGLIVGLFGLILGLLLGVGLGSAFEWAQINLGILPASVYRIGHINVTYRLIDIALISANTLVICGLATLAPALKAARMTPFEGLRFE